MRGVAAIVQCPPITVGNGKVRGGMRDFHVVLRMLPAFVDVRDQMLIHGFSSLLRTGLNFMEALRHLLLFLVS